MRFVDWIMNVEKMTLKRFHELPQFYQEKLRMNYLSYCETYGLM